MGVAPFNKTACAVETNDNEGRITSHFEIFSVDKDKCKAALPLFTAIQLDESVYFLNSVSNFDTFPLPLPDAQKPLFRVLTNAAFSFLSIVGSKSLIIFHQMFFPF